jgi:hypothetical protein
MKYEDFLAKRNQVISHKSIEPRFLPIQMMDFQRHLVSWALATERAALFADCGMGKTLMQLTWAQNIYLQTGKPVLVLTPLAVGSQTVREGEKFGIDCAQSRNGKIASAITITNYEQLHKFDCSQFSGVVCDESGILKSFDGKLRDEIVRFMRGVPYRLLATAVPSPNDYVELGNSSESLGYLGYMDMLSRFFRNYRDTCSSRRFFGEAPKWQFKGHSQVPFWRWVSTWARACRKPSDVGFDDGQFILPPLEVNKLVVDNAAPPPGMLFAVPATTLPEQRAEVRRTLTERCEVAAEKVSHDNPALVWCNLNDEAKLIKKLIPDAVEVSGTDSDESREEKFNAFLSGQARVLITKPKIGGWGLNFQHCAHMTYFPTHSFEAWYQSIRRLYRFGQTKKVVADMILTPGEQRIYDNLKRKEAQTSDMFTHLVREMNNAQSIDKHAYENTEELPQWL